MLFTMQSIPSKGSIKRSFSRASTTYDLYSRIQEDVNLQLLNLVPEGHFHEVLEIGCGTGSFTKALATKRKVERIVGVDLSYDMLLVARDGMQNHHTSFYPVCCDGERLALNPGSRFDLVVSASCMHWFQDLGRSLSYLIDSHLAPDGCIICALFGKNTLNELEKVINLLTGHAIQMAPSTFPTKDEVASILKGRRFSQVFLESVMISREYGSLMELLMSLKKTGTAPSAGSSRVFYTPRTIKKAERLYKKLYGSIRATFQVIFFLAR